MTPPYGYDEDYGTAVPSEQRNAKPPRTMAERRAVVRRARKGRPKPGALAIVLLLLVGVVGTPAGWMWWQLDPPTDPGPAATFIVEPGATSDEIATLLERNGVIGSAWAFKVYVAASGSRNFKAGQYTLATDIGVKPAIAALAKGGAPVAAPTKKLDLGAPGLTLEQIAQRMTTLGLDSRKFLDIARSGMIRSKFQAQGVNSLEGLVVPLVYEVPVGTTEVQVAELLRNEFDSRMEAAGVGDTSRASAMAGRTISPYEAIVTASMIQREAGVPADQPQIAAVVYNRIRDGMKLQIDATVLYAKGTFSATLTLRDLSDTDSPYNTYRVDGFPPTPIGTFNPEFLAAALNPTDTTAKFYVKFEDSGAHAFADTLEQHNTNIADAQRRGVI